MVELNEIKQYVNGRLGKVTTIHDFDFKLSNTLEINNSLCIIFTVDNDSLIFVVGNSVDNDGLVIIIDEKIKENTSSTKFYSKKSFINTLYTLLYRYTKYRDKIQSNGIEHDIFDWH